MSEERDVEKDVTPHYFALILRRIADAVEAREHELGQISRVGLSHAGQTIQMFFERLRDPRPTQGV